MRLEVRRVLIRSKYKNKNTLFTAQEWANGIYIRAKAYTNPDGKADGTGYSNYLQESISESLYTGSMAVIDSTKSNITQNNRTITINWSTINPKNSIKSQNHSGFNIEQRINNVGSKIGEVGFELNTDTITNYNYEDNLKNEEGYKGFQNYEFRIIRNIFNSNECWAEFMNSYNTINVNTEYRTIKITGITREKDSIGADIGTTALITWDYIEPESEK